MPTTVLDSGDIPKSTHSRLPVPYRLAEKIGICEITVTKLHM